MEKFKNLNIYLKVSIITALITVIAVAISSFCFANGNQDIPFGILLGGTLATLVYVLEYYADKKDHERVSVKWAIVLMIARFFVFAGFLAMVAVFQFSLGWKVFNIFSYCGGYLVSPIVFAILMLLEKENKDDSRK